MNTEDLSVDVATRCGRIVGPVSYRAMNGHEWRIPIGACLVEHLESGGAVIIWGARGQCCASFPAEEIQTARALGYLVILD
jgi:hypothetical protein